MRIKDKQKGNEDQIPTEKECGQKTRRKKRTADQRGMRNKDQERNED